MLPTDGELKRLRTVQRKYRYLQKRLLNLVEAIERSCDVDTTAYGNVLSRANALLLWGGTKRHRSLIPFHFDTSGIFDEPFDLEHAE